MTRSPFALSGSALLAVALAILSAPASYAQETPGAVTTDAVLERIKVVEAAADLDAELKGRLLDTYRQTLEELRAYDGWASKTRSLVELGAGAPAQTAALSARMSSPPPPVLIPSDASLRDLVAMLQKAETELLVATKERDDLEQNRRDAAALRVQLPKLTGAARARLDEAERAMRADPSANEPTALTEARKALHESVRRAAVAELSYYEQNVTTGEVVGLLLAAQADLAERRAASAKEQVAALRTRVGAEKRTQAATAVEEARKTLDSLSAAPEFIRELAADNLALATERVAATGPIAVASELTVKRQEVEDALRRIRRDLATVRTKVDVLGLVETTGLLLRRERMRLPEIETFKSSIGAYEAQMSRTQLRLVELEDERARLTDIEAQARIIETGPDDVDAVRVLLGTRRNLIEKLVAEHNVRFYQLVELSASERQLVSEVEAFTAYVDERVLWIRSSGVLAPGDVSDAARGIGWLATGAHWRSVGSVLMGDPIVNVVWIVVVALLFIFLKLVDHRLKRGLSVLAEDDPSVANFTKPLKALLLTVLMAMPLPLLLAVAGWRLESSTTGAEFPGAVAYALRATALFVFMVEFVRQICVADGLAQAHFRWSADSLRFARRELLLMALPVVPLVFLVSVTEAQGSEVTKSSLGRLAFLGWMVAFSYFGHRLLRSRSPLLQKQLGQVQEGWLFRFRPMWHAFALGVPLVLTVVAVLGYYYAALQLTWRLLTQIWVLLGVMTIEAISFRWLYLARRILAIRQAERRKAERAAPAEETDLAQSAHAVDAKPNLHGLALQSRRFIRYIAAFALVLAAWSIWADVLPAFGMMRRIVLWSSINGMVTLADVALGIAILVVTGLAAANIPGLLQILILQRLPLDIGVRYATATIARYAISITGMILALGAVGVSWSSVQWLVAAMTVGLGFGLQEIFANFISGLIILFERPIRIGDVVTVGNVTGFVSRIRIRATTITDWDRKELVVPNKEFITGQLVNWSLSDQIIRLIIPVGIAYGSDTELAHKTLIDIARANEHVLDDPAPFALFLKFGESALDFELRVYIENIKHYLPAFDTLNTEIDQAFRKAGIEIAFPQRDIHVRSIHQSLPIVNVENAGLKGNVPTDASGQVQSR